MERKGDITFENLLKRPRFPWLPPIQAAGPPLRESWAWKDRRASPRAFARAGDRPKGRSPSLGQTGCRAPKADLDGATYELS